MARIDKHPGAKFPSGIAATGSERQTRFRSTKQTDHAKALQFGRMLEYSSRESKAGRVAENRAREN